MPPGNPEAHELAKINKSMGEIADACKKIARLLETFNYNLVEASKNLTKALEASNTEPPTQDQS